MKTQTKPETLVDYSDLTCPMMLYPEVDDVYRLAIVDLPGCLFEEKVSDDYRFRDSSIKFIHS